MFLQTQNLVVDAFLIDKRWNYEELRTEFSQLFSKVLQGEHELIGFEFVKAAGTCIFPINLPSGQQLDGKMLKHITGAGPVYLRTLEQLVVDTEQEEFDDDDQLPVIRKWSMPDVKKDNVDNSEVEILNSSTCTPAASYSPATDVYEEPSTSSQQSDITLQDASSGFKERFEMLQQIFVGKDAEELTKAALRHANVDDPINDILDSALDSNDLSDKSSADDDFHQEDLPLLSARNSLLVLRSYRQQMVETATQSIQIDRQSPNFLRDVIRIYKRHGFNNEMGIDGGGLTKEFFYLVLTKLRDGDPSIGISLFEGAADHIVPIHCSSSLDSGLFHLFGKILAHSILHGGMAPSVAKYIATRSMDEAAMLVSIEDIPDLEYREYAKKILEASTTNELRELHENPTVLTLLDSAGFVGQQLSGRNAPVAVQQIMMHEVLRKRVNKMADIASGMDTLSLQKLLSACPDLLSVVFPTSKALAIDPSLLKGMLKTEPILYKGIPENENAFKWLSMYIDQCAKEDSKVSLSHLCMFATGWPQIGKIKVEFHTDKSKVMPKAATCPRVLTLPVCHQTYEDFKKQMDNALWFESEGFHLV